MSLIVNTNTASLNAQRNLSSSGNALAISLQRLSSGLRVNSAKDDAAGLAVAEDLTRAIRGNNQSMRNASDGISVGQTAEGALGQISNNLQRVREIAVQASNGSVSDTNRLQLQNEVDQLTQEISRIVQTTEFNGTFLLSGAATIMFQVGYSGDAANQVTFTGAELTTGSFNSYNASLTNTQTIDVTTQALASAALADLDTDIAAISDSRATFGAVQNRFEAVIANLQNFVENLSASKSRILDADYAAETAAMTRNQILQQAGTAILAQANQVPQAALTLLRG